MSRLNKRTITKMSFTYFVGIIWCLSFYIVHGQENVLHFTEQNCSTINMRQTSTIESNTIMINNCSLKTLPKVIFGYYTTTLSIYNTDLELIESSALDGLKGLQILSLHRNHLTKISSWSDHDLFYLHKLDMHHNKIQTISLNAFPTLSEFGDNKFVDQQSNKYSCEHLQIYTAIEDFKFSEKSSSSH
ncbi:hypothetical protein HA402_007192 [Bradysia odoriphaga]|nr:hypothetical protein HA402_007192 [Bradysia odoriphaga]